MTALRIVIGLLSMVALSGSSDGRGPCEHVAATYTAFNQKAQTCLSPADTVIPFDAVACQVNTKECSSADRATIEAFLDCVDAMPVCGDHSAWRAQFDACGAGARLSTGCSL